MPFLSAAIINQQTSVVEAIHLGRFEDVAGGEGGPFNPRVPEEVAAEVKVALELLEQYH